MDPPTRPAFAASRIVSAQVSGSSPNPFSRSAETGRLVASTITRECPIASSRLTAPEPSGFPRENAKPALVVARASNPRLASNFAEPASQGLGMANTPGRSWSALNASAFVICRFICSSEKVGQTGSLPSLTGMPHRRNRCIYFSNTITRYYVAYFLCGRVFVVIKHRRLFAQQSGVGIKLSAMMPVFVVIEREILPNREHAVWRLELARQVFVSQRG